MCSALGAGHLLLRVTGEDLLDSQPLNESASILVADLRLDPGTREVSALLRNAEPKILISDHRHTDAAARAAAESSVSLLVLG